MRILVTGASGYIGNQLAHRLAAAGQQVHALIRSDVQSKSLQHANITLFKGDLNHPQSIARAMRGCYQVYHTAARTGAWAKDPRLFYTVNVDGTQNLLQAARKAGVERLVFTSSSGVLGPSSGAPVQEQAQRTLPFRIDYDRSKKLAEDLIRQEARSLPAVIVAPSKVYGPGPTSHALTANAIIQRFLHKRLAFIPYPGTQQVCFAYAPDVVQGHLLAMEKGRAGETYILGGHNISYYEFFNRIRTLAGFHGRIVPVSKWLIRTWAEGQHLRHRLTGAPVGLPRNAVDHAFHSYTFSSDKAMQQLGYTITPLDEALDQTIQFLRHETIR
jgi:nucleoside-diphosphate-sugar epimerase